MEFQAEWLTLGRHRTRLRCERGFPTERLRQLAEVARIGIECNLSAHARLVEIVAQREESYLIKIGTTFSRDKEAAYHLGPALAILFGLPQNRMDIDVTVVDQSEVDLHFGVYERMLAEKLGAVPPLQ
ncbi:hypothetical protein [Cupriavidus agavae]|uniref:Uncharacterized protein n=1 Tax=Cupriavidus agavae TaxID=1001822 RepID=A0A4Q7RPA7_9BURK|nr:hypothetical protein [Cupriavidus agavae]RZT35463.1 hypothetical protein EV147_3906 [Cupriavidus agavae]